MQNPHRWSRMADSRMTCLWSLPQGASFDSMIGWAGLAVPHFLPEVLPAVEVGWRLAGPWRGRGLATEAGAAAVEFGFTAGGLERIVSIYEPDNVASGRVMERLGFTHDRTTVGPRGEEVVVMVLERQRWRAGAGMGDVRHG